jgi:predicted O-methyltransferase YrrM
MVARSQNLSNSLYQYMIDHSVRETELLRELRQETSRLAVGDWQSAPEQSQFIALLIELTGAREILEIGTFTGYTTLWMALALPTDGRITTIEPATDFADIAQRYWKKAGQGDKIDLRLKNGIDGLDDLVREQREATFDLVYIDADKPNYPAYYETCHELLKTGGVILIDNVFRYGRVAEPADRKRSTRIMRKLNQMVFRDSRVHMCIIPIGDGLTIARKIQT